MLAPLFCRFHCTVLFVQVFTTTECGMKSQSWMLFARQPRRATLFSVSFCSTQWAGELDQVWALAFSQFSRKTFLTFTGGLIMLQVFSTLKICSHATHFHRCQTFRFLQLFAVTMDPHSVLPIILAFDFNVPFSFICNSVLISMASTLCNFAYLFFFLFLIFKVAFKRHKYLEVQHL